MCTYSYILYFIFLLCMYVHILHYLVQVATVGLLVCPVFGLKWKASGHLVKEFTMDHHWSYKYW